MIKCHDGIAERGGTKQRKTNTLEYISPQTNFGYQLKITIKQERIKSNC